MKTENHSINDVLAKNATSFFIPPFQRAYAWGKPEIERYFSDILNIINSELDVEQHDKLEHFFGTVVIKEEKEGFASRSIIVDGQQRLTTTLLFLIALRDVEVNTENKDYITQNYLTNNSSSFEDKIKLKQVTKDWEAYRSLVNKSEPDYGIIKTAYQHFSTLIKGIKSLNPQINLNHYITAIGRINVAVIFLDERPFKGEDPQIIFETLNSLGKPLTLSDLIRNFVLLNMGSKDQSDMYENVWHPKIEAILDEKTSEFFRDYLQYKTVSSIKAVSDNNTKEVYQIFKNFVKDNFLDNKIFINDIVRYTNWYKWIITNVVTDTISSDAVKDKEIKELIRNIFHDIKAEAFKPFVLGVLEYHQCTINNCNIKDDRLISILKTIRTYLIRRRVLGLTQGENKSIVLLSNRIEDLAKSEVSIIDLLCNMFYKMRLPNNDEVKRELLIMNFYEARKKYSKFILGKIEENNTKVAVDFRNPKITIEHVMPQKLTSSWRSDLGKNHEQVQKTYLHNIGNLILTEFNSEIGNKSFADKKKKLNTSSLNYRLDVIDKKVWNETSIKKHQKNMINWFLETFPLPNNYKEKDNWNIKEIENANFSPMNEDARDIAEGNKPAKMKIGRVTVSVKTWQEVFIRFIQYIEAYQKDDFNFIIDNQSELFSKEDIILKWSDLKLLVEDNIDLTSSYKTFDTKVWEKVKHLKDDMFFIHIHMSSRDCIKRISNVMNKINMVEDFVEIILKDNQPQSNTIIFE